jgi:hypothetical protein
LRHYRRAICSSIKSATKIVALAFLKFLKNLEKVSRHHRGKKIKFGASRVA